MNLKLKLFQFKNELTIEQLDVSKVIQLHLENYDKLSEKELFTSLHESLSPFTYDKSVKDLLESVKGEIEAKPLVYELKDLYKKVERKNINVLYRPALAALLNIINKEDDDSRMESILNELAIYNWVPEIKQFLFNLTKSPIERQNMKNSGKISKVYTIVEKVDDGHLSFIADRWFLISENDIKQVDSNDYFKDIDKMREIRILENVLSNCEIVNEEINFKIDEQLEINLSLKDNVISLNGEKLDKETTLETLFNSPIIPYLKRNYFELINTTLNNSEKFVELDIVMKVNNILKPFNESFVFNYKDKVYLYSKDTRYNSYFYEFENAMALIHEMQKEFDCDLTHFYENKVSSEIKKLKKLEDKEKSIEITLKDISESIEMIKDEADLLKESKELTETYNNMLALKHKYQKELKDIKNSKIEERKKIVK